MGNLVDLNVSGRRARQERLAGLQSTRKVLSLCPLTMAYSWSGALGPRVVPRAAHDVNSCLSRVFWCSLGSGWPGWGGSHACFAPYCAGDVVLETGCKFGRPVSASAAVISDHNSGFSRRCAGLGISVGTRRRPADKQHVAAPGMWTRCCGDDTQSRSLACVYAHLTTGEPRSAASASSWGRRRAQLLLRVHACHHAGSAQLPVLWPASHVGSTVVEEKPRTAAPACVHTAL